ncbi:ubiquitin-like-specific protease 1D isoform X1 [Morus notabilis]|uniref:ubiquitin-like-specific protease 1D isoform X1 n=1 Tax=Morus notabilis TaxID=981085 RepID=UPI000CED7E2C|nr:ubiquitin-like-specific protease 1D isoform X1 [Morus notabilis]
MGKRKLSKEIITIDLESPTSPVADYGFSQHRSCWKHVLATLKARKKRLTKKETEAIDSFKLTAPCLLNHTCGERSKRKTTYENAGHGVSKLNKELLSSTFEMYFEFLWRGFSEDKGASCAYLDCLWFSLYKKRDYKSKVLKWIKDKNIFSKKYVLVPIVIWSHWSFLIFCNFDESLESTTRTPCMLLLDSLESADPRRLEPDIRKFVYDIYRTEDRPQTQKSILKIPLLTPQVPQQRSDWECGNFVLYFIKLFMDGAPENFSIKDFPYFMKRNWFTPEDVDCFCEGLYSDVVATRCS